MQIKKIIILINSLRTGGAEKQSIYLANTLSENFDVYFIIFYGDQIDATTYKALTLEANKQIKLNGNIINKIYRLYVILKSNKDAVIFSYLATTNFLNATIGIFAKTRFRIGGIRNSVIPFSKRIIQRFLHNNILTKSIFNSYDGMEKLCRQGFVKSKSLVIHNCIDVKETPRSHKNNEAEVNIITVGRLVRQKDFFTALKAFEILLLYFKEKGSALKISFTIVGYGPLESKMRAYILEHKLTSNVRIVINPPNTREYLSRADIYLSTSLFEGLSNSIMEAMEYSLPVVATDVGDNNRLIIHGKSGFLTKVKGVEEIASRLLELIENNELRLRMGLNGYYHLKENFSVEKFKQRYQELIDNLYIDQET